MAKTVFAFLLLASVALAQQGGEYNPHHGHNHLFVTPWEHNENVALRAICPIEIRNSVWTGQGTAFLHSSENPARPRTSNLFPILANPNDPKNPESWLLYEDWAYQYHPVQGGGFAINKLFDGKHIYQWRFVVKDGDYIQFIELPKNSTGNIDGIRIASNVSKVNYVQFGSKYKQWGSGKTEMVDATFYPAGTLAGVVSDNLVFTPSLIVEHNGVDYIRVWHDGKQHGIKLHDISQ